MPNVRHGNKRRREACPSCGRDISYTVPYARLDDHSVFAEMLRKQKDFAPHRNPQGERCPG